MESARMTDSQRDLVEKHADLPARMANALARNGDVEEATSEAQFCLVESAMKFEAGRGEFRPFASQRIRWHLLKWLRKRRGAQSLDAPIGEDEAATLHDLCLDPRSREPAEILQERDGMKGALRTLKKRGSIRLEECREKTPAPIGLGAYYQQMRSAVCESVSSEDVQAIMRSLVEKAKGGDVNAAKLVLQQVAGPAAPRVTQTIEIKEVTLADFEEGGDKD